MTLRATDATLKAGSMTRDAADNLKHFSSRCPPHVLPRPLAPRPTRVNRALSPRARGRLMAPCLAHDQPGCRHLRHRLGSRQRSGGAGATRGAGAPFVRLILRRTGVQTGCQVPRVCVCVCVCVCVQVASFQNTFKHRLCQEGPALPTGRPRTSAARALMRTGTNCVSRSFEDLATNLTQRGVGDLNTVLSANLTQSAVFCQPTLTLRSLP